MRFGPIDPDEDHQASTSLRACEAALEDVAAT
jgi:hypothetical protein